MLIFVFVLLWIPNVAVLPEELPLHAPIVFVLALTLLGATEFQGWKTIFRVPGFKLIVFSTLFLSLLAAAGYTWSFERMRVFRIAYAMGSGLVVLLTIVWCCNSPNIVVRLFKCFAFAAIGWTLLLVCVKFIPELQPIFISIAGQRSAEDLLEGRDRFSGFFKQPNQYGIALSAALGSVLSLAVSSRGARLPEMLLYWLGVGGIATSLVLAGSKANILLFMVIVAWVGLAVSLNAKNVSFAFVRILVVALFGLLAVAVGSAFLEFFNPRAFRILNSFLTDDYYAVSSVRTRNVIWEYSWRIALDNPILGVGAGSKVLGYSHSHNVVLDYFRGMGVPGLVGVLTVISGVAVVAFKAFRGSWKLPREMKLLFPVLVGGSAGSIAYVAANMSSDSFGPATILFLYINLGFTISALRYSIIASSRRRRSIQKVSASPLKSLSGS